MGTKRDIHIREHRIRHPLIESTIPFGEQKIQITSYMNQKEQYQEKNEKKKDLYRLGNRRKRTNRESKPCFESYF